MRGRYVGWLYIVTTLLLVLAVPPARAANLIINGSFETPDLSHLPLQEQYRCVAGSRRIIAGWRTILGGVEWFNPQIYAVGAAQDGLLALDLNTDNCAQDPTYVGGGIEQDIPTTVGASYILSFYGGTWLGAGRNGSGHIEVSVDGGTSFTTFTVTATVPYTIVWQKFSMIFEATASRTTVMFRNSDVSEETFSLLDHVFVSKFHTDACP